MKRCISLRVSLVLASRKSTNLVAIFVARTVPNEVAKPSMKIWDRLVRSICIYCQAFVIKDLPICSMSTNPR